MKLQTVSFLILLAISVSFAQDYRCIIGTNCDTDKLRRIAEEARDNLTQAVRTRLSTLIERLNFTQLRIVDAITSETFKDNLRDELSGNLQAFRNGSDEFVTNLIQHLMRDTTSIRATIKDYTSRISFNHFEMIVDNIKDSESFRDIITGIRNAKQCFLDNLYERGFMNTTSAVRAVITRSRNTIDRISALTRTALTNLAPVNDKIRAILDNFRPIPSCLQIFSTSLGCRLCQFPDNQIALQARPCFGFCDQAVTYCLSVVRGALPDVRDVVRVIKLISEALEGKVIEDRFNATLLSFGALATSIEQLGESVINFLQEFDIVEFIRDVADECFPDLTQAIRDLYDSFRQAVRVALALIRDAIEAALDRIRDRLLSAIDYFDSFFSRRRRLISNNELPLLDRILDLVVDDFCENLPSSSRTADQCWNGTAIAPYRPDNTAGFSVADQANNPVVRYAEFTTAEAVSSAQAGVSALSATSATSGSEVCDSLGGPGGNASLYNELSSSNEACFSELNGSGATLLAGSLFLLMSILAIHSLYLF